ALVWPVLGYGYYPSFIDYPGSVSVPDEIFAETARAVIAGMAFSGVKRIVVINTGISTIAPLESALRGATWQATVILHNAYAGPKFTALEQRLSEQTFGGHADEIETSIMLALDESVVDMDVAKPQPTRISRGLFNRSEPDQANYSPDGVNGDPTLATREKGQLLLRALSDDCLAVCDKG
ncbi:MAG: creatininase family protein, partial [Pseudomonadota bacterium]